MTRPDPNPEQALSGCIVFLGIALALFTALVLLAYRHDLHVAFTVYCK